MRPHEKCVPSALNSSLSASSCRAGVVSTLQPFSLKAAPKPSHVCAAVASLTVTSAVAPVTSVKVPTFQKSPMVDVTSAGPGGGLVLPPVPVPAVPVGVPPVPVGVPPVPVGLVPAVVLPVPAVVPLPEPPTPVPVPAVVPLPVPAVVDAPLEPVGCAPVPEEPPLLAGESLLQA